MDPTEAAVRNNLAWVDSLYERYRRDPDAVGETWRSFFGGFELGLRSGATEAQDGPASLDAPRPTAEAAPGVPERGESELAFLTESGALPEGVDHSSLTAALRVYDLVHTYRTYGHLAADLDPLGRSQRSHPLLDLQQFGFSEADLDQRVTCETYKGFREGTLREFIEHLDRTYCGPIGVEYMDVTEKDQRDWLQEQMEPCANHPELDGDQRLSILRELVRADAFEESLQRMYPGAKRFSLEGGTTLVTLMQTLTEDASADGVEQVITGMAHRGRLNVLAHVLGKPYTYILAEFEDRPLPSAVEGYGDVKYHLGYSRDHETSCGRTIHVSLAFNPSHLEAVDPVVEGIVRAKQNHLGDAERRKVIPVLIHGDAAFSGQGVVAETFMLGGLEGYRTGGTVHVILNNQIGFTTEPREARSTRYASDLAKTARAPVFHVNADHPEAVQRCAQLALGFRQRFHQDVVIDLICYRRHGHNETDDPSFTQPVVYGLIKKHPSNSRAYAEKLVAGGIVTEEEVDEMASAVSDEMSEARHAARDMAAQYIEQLGGIWQGLRVAGPDWSADTRVPREVLTRVARSFVQVPEGFNWHRRLEKLMKRRSAMVLDDEPIDWGCAEALAVGSLLLEGTKVRLTGQDSIRGTFSHRHAAYVDQETGERWVPLNHLSEDQNVFQLYNSPLSEAGCLGFEYGYSTADPWTLVVWEAQFGDFINGAQVVVDQLIASCEYKWARMSGIVLLLPHGYEGQGPEHSSARLERFLALCAEQNMQVCNFTTPAQYFHALRRQMHRDFRKPLVVMAPKSLLRHQPSFSRVEELADGTFRPLLDDERVSDRDGVRKLLVCSGKVFYALDQERLERDAQDVAIARLEQLYPFPLADYRSLLASYPNLEQVAWVQEEPENMGAWRNTRHRLESVLPRGVTLEYVGRDAAAVPATGSFEVHVEAERALLEGAFRAPPRPARPRAVRSGRARRRSS